MYINKYIYLKHHCVKEEDHERKRRKGGLEGEVGRPMPGRKASTPTICALVVQVRKLPEEKKREKKKKKISME